MNFIERIHPKQKLRYLNLFDIFIIAGIMFGYFAVRSTQLFIEGLQTVHKPAWNYKQVLCTKPHSDCIWASKRILWRIFLPWAYNFRKRRKQVVCSYIFNLGQNIVPHISGNNLGNRYRSHIRTLLLLYV